MFYTKRTMVATALLIAFCSGSIAHAGDFSSEFHARHGGTRHHTDTHPSIAGGDGLPSYVRGIGTYAGGMSAVRFKRNGIYFTIDGGSFNRGYVESSSTVRPRIIQVNRRTIGAECSYEAGVCVIRP